MPESYGNDYDNAEVFDQLSNKAELMDLPLDFSVVKVRSKLGCNVSSFAYKMPVLFVMWK